MFVKHQATKTNNFVNANNLHKADKKDKSTPHVNVKVSAYDKVVTLVTNDDTGTVKVNDESEKYILMLE